MFWYLSVFFAAGPANRIGRMPSTTRAFGSTFMAEANATQASTAEFEPYRQGTDEVYMSPEQEAHFREILLAWKKSLMEEVDRTVHHMQDEATNFPDPNDRATQESEFSLELRTRDRERKLIKKIDEALGRIDDHEYGFCEACGVEIGIRRLEARPTATLCIDCKTLDEIRERQRG
jgi:DnaK suppressor protein